ncbi:MAG TPA: peroxiredoxin [Candidatus Baltobacteraceae bacterium]|jgi:peroxiredoxin Q/BCP|nr:peroxiredoxin [Candidatus Baltobacteraceae bacterium]
MLAAGDMIPTVSLVDPNGANVPLQSLLERPIVLYFYPKDDTPGCTVEACAFRDAYETFVERGADVIGVSSDDSARHARFATKHRLPFRLMSDPGARVRLAFGIPKTFGVLPGRATFVIDRNGIIRYAFNSQFMPGKHIETALAALQTMTATR